MDALDFLLCCLGVSSIIVASGTAYRLVAGTLRQSGPTRGSGEIPGPVSQNEIAAGMTPSSDLDARLRRFQQERFASSLTRRVLEPSDGPRVRGAGPSSPALPTVLPKARRSIQVVDQGNIPILLKNDKEGK